MDEITKVGFTLSEHGRAVDALFVALRSDNKLRNRSDWRELEQRLIELGAAYRREVQEILDELYDVTEGD